MNQKCALHEEARLASLHRLNILDTPPERSFDRITRLAQMALQMPIVMISLIDRDRSWFKSKQGLDAIEICRSESFCVCAIEQEEPFIVTDAARHPLFADNPFVTGDPHIVYYIGIPLKMRDGFMIGTLCAMDRQSRDLSADQIAVLRDLAQMVVDDIELRQIATADSLTGALTRRGFDIEIEREISRSKRSHKDLSLIILDIDHFKSVNDRYGHAAGDLVLKSVVTLIRQELRPSDSIARLGGEEFVIVLPETGLDEAKIVAERICKTISETAEHGEGNVIRVTASLGIASLAASDETWGDALARADTALYEAKRRGRDRCVCHGDMRASSAAA